MEIIKLDPKEFGVTTKSANEIELAFQPKIAEREALAVIYKQIIKKEITEEVCEEAGEVTKKLVKVRTGIAAVHKTQKQFALTYGKFVDAWKNKETLPGTQMEETLVGIRDHFEIIEQKRIDDLQSKRFRLVSKYLNIDIDDEPILYDMDQDVWEAYLSTKKKDFEDKQAAQLKAEQDRINALAIEKEARVKAEKEAKELKIKFEANQAIEIAATRKAENEAKKAKEELAKLSSISDVKIPTEDKGKLENLISDLENLKTKYSFESDYNKKLYSNVGLLIDKIVNYIN